MLIIGLHEHELTALMPDTSTKLCRFTASYSVTPEVSLGLRELLSHPVPHFYKSKNLFLVLYIIKFLLD